MSQEPQDGRRVQKNTRRRKTNLPLGPPLCSFSASWVGFVWRSMLPPGIEPRTEATLVQKLSTKMYKCGWLFISVAFNRIKLLAKNVVLKMMKAIFLIAKCNIVIFIIIIIHEIYF